MWIIAGQCGDTHVRRLGMKISGYQFQSCLATYIEMFYRKNGLLVLYMKAKNGN